MITEKSNMADLISFKCGEWNRLVWFRLVCLFIHSVTHVTLYISITDYNLYITTQLTIYGHPPNIIHNK
jgi:hypothetical protein